MSIYRNSITQQDGSECHIGKEKIDEIARLRNSQPNINHRINSNGNQSTTLIIKYSIMIF